MFLKSLFISATRNLKRIPPQVERIMKLTTFMLLAVCLQVSAKGISQKVTLSAKNAALENVIRHIKKQTGYSFFYNADWLQKAKKVTVEVKDMDIEDALNIVFKDQPLGYSIINNTIVLKLKEVIPAKAVETLHVLSPPPDVHGRVINEKGEAMEGVTVTIKRSRQATATNANGEFNLPASKGAVLVFTYVNYQSQEVSVGSQTSFNITLQPQSAALNDVVVIGYGSRQKKDVTGAVSTVGAKDIEKSTSMTPELALEGKAAGVFVASGGGEPQSRPTIRIRGVNTFGFSDPLYVVDGLPIYEGGAGVTGGATGDIRSPINIFSLINPGDIESISILKDASAAAIYGVRASNGVILITTKKGRAGRPKVEVNTYYGIQNMPKEKKVLNTQQYFDLITEEYNNNPDMNNGQVIPIGTKFGPLYDPGSAQYAGHSPTYDWQKELMNKNAPLQDYSVRVSGGGDNTTYYFSGGYSKTESPLKGNFLERYSIATNVDSRISKYVQAGLNVRLIQEHSLVNTQADPATMMSTIPFQPFYDNTDITGFAPVAAGTFKPNPDYDPSLLNPGAPFIFDGDPRLLWGPQTRFNVFAFQALNNNKYDLLSALGSAYVQVEPIAGLRLKGTLQGAYYINLRKSWSDVDQWRFSQTPGNPYAGQDGSSKGSYGERQGRTNNLNKELTLSYNHTFAKDHNVDIVLSASQQKGQWFVTDLSGQVNSADPQYRGISNQPPFTSGFGGILEEDALIGYLGRISYKFQDKYYLDGTFRYDGSSRLAPGHKWDKFPSFGAAWRISSEKFFPKTTFISDLKLRGGYGKLGNYQSAGRYKFLSGVSQTPDYPLGSGNGDPFGTQLPGAALPDFANITLTWEKVKSANAGFDALLFKGAVSLTAEYYNKITYDIIQSVGLPPNTGIQNPADLNIGKVRNSGIEVQLGYNKKFGAIDFNASGNITTVSNKVIKLNEGTPQGDEFGRIEEGYSMFYLWGYKVGGIFQSQAEIDAWRKNHADVTLGQDIKDPSVGYQYKPGDMYFQDVYSNPKNPKEQHSPGADSLINSADRTYLGKTIPGYYYGFNFGASWKGIDVSVFFQGVGDVKKYNGTRAGLEAMGGLANQWATVLDRWTPTHASTTIPRAVYGDLAQTARASDRYIESGAYLRLKNIQLGYTIPKTVLNKLMFVQNVRIYASGVNLFTITKYTGLDPESDSGSGPNGINVIPNTRQFLFGINATF